MSEEMVTVEMVGYENTVVEKNEDGEYVMDTDASEGEFVEQFELPRDEVEEYGLEHCIVEV